MDEGFISVPPVYSDMYTHATLCMLALEGCAQDYCVINIQLTDNMLEAPVNITTLKKALGFCICLRPDIVCLSIGTTKLSDYETLQEELQHLRETETVLFAAVSNDNLITLPAHCEGIFPVICDRTNQIPPWREGHICPYGLKPHVVANSRIMLPHKTAPLSPSNSLAVPVVAAQANALVNRGAKKHELHDHLCQIGIPLANHIFHDFVRNEMPPAVVLWFGGLGTVQFVSEAMTYLATKMGYETICLTPHEVKQDPRFFFVNDSDTAHVSSSLSMVIKHAAADMVFVLIESISGQKVSAIMSEADLVIVSEEVEQQPLFEGKTMIQIQEDCTVDALCESIQLAFR
jgi:hypothetical protein